MPKSRSKASKSDAGETAQDSTSGVSQQATQTSNQTKGENVMAGETLSAEDIVKILSTSRTKGAGEEVLQGFKDRGNPGEVVDLTTGPLAGKNANQAFSTLNNAKKRTRQEGDKVVVVNPQFAKILVKKVGKGDDAQVALINTELVNVG